ncbi:MAG: DOMON-like domain-containing protein [Burkholderiales bacterium]|nr:DOMON-like domain-containing protein [Burkholderiales bacterium]
MAASKDHPSPLTLSRHPGSPSGGVEHADVSASALPGALALCYRLRGALRRIAVPEPARPARRDGLWRHTCFECFVRIPGQRAYAEFNVSPSGEWAAYRFDACRAGMRPLELDEAPRIELVRSHAALELRTRLRLPAPWDGAPRLQLALTAVVEEVSGALSYWALAHPPGKPDFHRDDGFALMIETGQDCSRGTQ